MFINKSEIIIRNAVSYKINDTTKFEPATKLLEITDEVSEYLRTHIYKIIASDDKKYASFKAESEVKRALINFNEKNLLDVGHKIAHRLYLIINSNPTIPGCDLFIVTYQLYDQIYLGILKMNNQETYAVGDNVSKIIKQKFTLPMNVKLTEAAFIDMAEFELELVEKKYEINGEKMNYFSITFIECIPTLSNKKKIQVINRAIERAVDRYSEKDPFNAPLIELDIRKHLFETYNEMEEVNVNDFIEGIKEQDIKEEIYRYLKKYKIIGDVITIDNALTTKLIVNALIETDLDIKILINLANYSRDIFETKLISGKVILSIKEINALTCKR